MRDKCFILETVIESGKCGNADLACPYLRTRNCSRFDRDGPRALDCPFGNRPITVIAAAGARVKYEAGSIHLREECKHEKDKGLDSG
ncbi:MAG: hypothetical protein QXS54_11545 [Candidatus Methanomethylicaceae archaeon]